MQAVYIDKKSSTLNDNQVEVVNNILFNMKRRFEQASYQETKDKPAVVNFSRNINGKYIFNYNEKVYDNSAVISFVINLSKTKNVGQTLKVVEFPKNIKTISSFGIDSLSIASETLPGYFYKSVDNLMFYCSVEHSSNYYYCTVLMELEEDE